MNLRRGFYKKYQSDSSKSFEEQMDQQILRSAVERGQRVKRLLDKLPLK